MESLSNEFEALAQSGQISERDKPFMEAFKKVYESILRIEETARQIEETGDNAGDLKEDAKERLGELHNSVDRLQTSALQNPALQPFAGRVVRRAREMSQKVEEFAQENFLTE